MTIRIPSASLALACMLFANCSAIAHPRETLTTQAAAHQNHASVTTIATTSDDDAPRVRIRGDRDGKGLTPQAFSRWINRHPALIRQARAESSLQFLASTESRLRTIDRIFDSADTNQDGRISADELADYLTRNAPARVPADAT